MFRLEVPKVTGEVVNPRIEDPIVSKIPSFQACRGQTVGDSPCYYFSVPRGARGPVSYGATENEGPYLRPSSQRSWMEAMRAHRKCVPSSFIFSDSL